MIMHFLLITFLFAAFVDYSYACVCMPSHPQTAFCKAGFAIKARVLSKRKFQISEHYQMLRSIGADPRVPYYDIGIDQIFKGDRTQLLSNISITKENIIKTKAYVPNNAVSCQRFLMPGEDYVLTGRYYGDKIHVDSCGLTGNWKEMDQVIRNGLLGDFDCDCAIATCVEGYCDAESSCKWQAVLSKPSGRTDARQHACRMVNQKCQWVGVEDIKRDGIIVP